MKGSGCAHINPSITARTRRQLDEDDMYASSADAVALHESVGPFFSCRPPGVAHMSGHLGYDRRAERERMASIGESARLTAVLVIFLVDVSSIF